MDLNFQYAHHSCDESEDQHGITSDQAIEAFDKFDWLGQSENANELQKCSPTLGVIKDEEQHLIWVSSYIDGDTIKFFSGCKFPGEVSAWFGLSKKEGVVQLHNAGSFSKEAARQAITLFLSEDYAGLKNLYKRAS
jgi:hypothetical protein